MEAKPTSKTLTIDWDGKRNLEALLSSELTAGWKEVNKVYDPVAGKVTFTFEPYPPTGRYEEPPDSGQPDDDYYDWEDNEQYFEYDGDAKATFWHGQQIS